MMTDMAKAKSVFLKAIEEHEPDQWSSFLDIACADDDMLRGQIEKLLKAHSQLGTYHGKSTEDVAPTQYQALTEKLGTWIDRYKLVHEIGHGGMGMVYMAVQKVPVKRKVALKIIRPGMDTEEVVARFEAERQALALMDHQCIAKVLDGGSTPSGRPYFVMELVEGTPITKYCDECQFTTRQRLELFVQVCQAVQHAHQKGIIHRDIKPSNILVTNVDDRAVPKVIDFGIAKAVHGQLADHSVYTHVAQMMGTPMYMSPEQAQWSGHDVDTRADVYSLGVLLYELLTGTTLFDSEQLKRSSPEEVKRIIREQEPPRPSTRLSTVDAASETIAETHHTDLRTLTRELTGELDWIVMKALEKDRTRRNESASDLAKDVQRYVNNEAVEACPPSKTYRLKKFVSRNKVALATIVIVALSLIIGFVGTTWQAIRATAAEVEASQQEELVKAQLARTEEQRQRAEANMALAVQALDEVYLTAIGEEKLLREGPFGGKEISQSPPEFSDLERNLLQRGLGFYDRFARQNQDHPLALFETGKAFYRVALVQTALGADREAQEAYTESISRLKWMTQEHPAEAKYFLELGRAYYGHAQLSRWWPSAANTFKEAKEALDCAIALDRKSAEAYQIRSKAHDHLTEYDEAISDLEAAVELAPRDPVLHRDLASQYDTIQDSRHRDHLRALKHAREAVKLDPKNYYHRALLARIYGLRFGKKASAAAVWDELTELSTEPSVVHRARVKAAMARSDYSAVIENVSRCVAIGVADPQLYVARAAAYRSLGEPDKAQADLVQAESLNANRTANANDILTPGNLNKSNDLYRSNQSRELSCSKDWVYISIANEYRRLGKIAKSFACLEKAAEAAPNNPYIYEIRVDIRLQKGHWQEALKDANKAVELVPNRSWIRKRRAAAHFRLGNYDESLADISKAVELTPKDFSNLFWIPPHDAAKCPDQGFRAGLLDLADKTIELTNDSARAYATRGWILAAFGREEGALADLKTAFDNFPEDGTVGSLGSSKTCHELGNLCGELAHREDVIPYLAKMTELQPKQPIVWYRCALAQLGSSETDAYKATCRGMVKALQGTTSPYEGYWTAWTCLLAPESVEDYSPLVQMAEQAVKAEPASDQYLKTLGGMLYRVGQFEEAVQRLTEADALVEEPDSKSTSSPAYGWYFLAMAQHKLANDAEAKQWLDKATEWTDRVLGEHEAGTSTFAWNRRLTLKLLREEAEQMIRVPVDEPKNDTQPEEEEGQKEEESA